MRILFSNLGYATGISGSLYDHVTRAYRHVYKSARGQQAVLSQFRRILDTEQPDLCCMIELEQGAAHTGWYNHIEALKAGDYSFHDVADKYGPGSPTGRLPFHSGKSNGFMARQPFDYERLYFRNGTKRLIYSIAPRPDLTVLFTHFSLNRTVRQKQFSEVREHMLALSGEVMLLADFNILNGVQELKPLLEDGRFRLLNSDNQPTFTFHNWRKMLDLCLYTPGLAGVLDMKVIPQPFSDHHALLIDIAEPGPKAAAA